MLRSGFFAAAFVLLATSAPAQAQGESCLITFRLGTSTALGTLNVFASYQNAAGEFEGTATSVVCEALNSTIISVGDVDAARTLSMAAVGLPEPIQGPKDILRCNWIPTNGAPKGSDFDLAEQTATNMSGQPVDPDVIISDIECGAGGTTTTTLEQPVCGDYNDNGSIEVSDALGVLRTAVGVTQCEPCVCDVDDNGSVSVTDALVMLRISVGQGVTTSCSSC